MTETTADLQPEVGPEETHVAAHPAGPARTSRGPLPHLAGLAAALGTLLWMMWPAFSADLGVIDDHEIVSMIGRHSHLSPTRIPSEMWTRTFEGNGRFRPFYWVIRVLESAFCGHNGTLWYIDRFLFAAVAVAAIYLTAARFMGPVAAYAVALVSFGGPQWETFIRLGPNEAYAYPLAVAGIAILVQQLANGRSPARLWPGYLLLVLSAFAKENFFVLILIAVPLSALVWGVRRLSRTDWLVMAGTLAVAAVDALAILLVVHRYGAVYPQSRTWDTFRSWTTFALTQANMYEYGTVGIVAALALLGIYCTTRRRAAVAGTLVALIPLIAVPQLLFYAGNPQVGRYLYPLVLVPTLAWGISLWRAADQPTAMARRTTTVVLLLVLAWPLHHAIYLSHVGAGQTATATRGFQTNLRTLVATAVNAHVDTVVLQPVDSLIDGERSLSVGRYLANTTDLHVMIMPPTTRGGGQDAQVADQIAGWSRSGFDGMEPYHKPAHCLSVVYGPVAPVCGAAINPPG